MSRMNRVIVCVMALSGFLGIATAALRFSSGLIGGVVCLFSLGLLMLSVAGVVYRRDARRAYCLGFALFGWGYIALAHQSWSQDEEVTDQWGLITTTVLDSIQPRLESNNDGSMDWFGFASAKTRRIWSELDKPLSMPFKEPAPLDEVLNYIRTATSGKGLPSGIPIIISPSGFNTAEAKPATITLDLEGLALRKSLTLMLDQLNLRYYVRDDVLHIVSKEHDVVRQYRSDQNTLNFRRVGHCLFALLIGSAGGVLTRMLYLTRERRRDPAESHL